MFQKGMAFYMIDNLVLIINYRIGSGQRQRLSSFPGFLTYFRYCNLVCEREMCQDGPSNNKHSVV